MKGPIDPAVMLGQQNEAPYPGATLLIQSTPALGSAAASTVTSGSDGTFTLSEPPGQYLITPQPGANGFPHAAPFLVSVLANQMSHIVVEYDTGIR
jgi:hypothetical protein